MNLPDNLHQWIAYIQDELPENEAAELEKAMNNNSELALQIEGLRKLKEECGDEISLIDFIAQKKAEFKKKWF